MDEAQGNDLETEDSLTIARFRDFLVKDTNCYRSLSRTTGKALFVFNCYLTC